VNDGRSGLIARHLKPRCVGGERKRVALGSYPTMSLSDARRKADERRRSVRDGVTSGAKRMATRTAAVLKWALVVW
jgi:Arm DNA-binding domain